MTKLIPLLVIIMILIEGFTSTVLSQDYSIRTNVLNLVAKGPSVALGKNINDNSEVLLTYSSGSFRPFFFEDSYKYSTIHLEYRRKDDNSNAEVTTAVIYAIFIKEFYQKDLTHLNLQETLKATECQQD